MGGLGRLLAADVPTLYLIGRMVSLACGIATAVLVGGYFDAPLWLTGRHRRCRVRAGAAPMIGYAVMTRPDMLADLAGAAGFFLACQRASRELGWC